MERVPPTFEEWSETLTELVAADAAIPLSVSSTTGAGEMAAPVWTFAGGLVVKASA